jgi:hypothetical protein
VFADHERVVIKQTRERLLGDDPSDRMLLHSMAETCADHGALMLAGATPSLLGLKRWEEAAMRDPAADVWWASFRKSDPARFVALTSQRVSLRAPFSAATFATKEFNSEGVLGEPTREDLVWTGASPLLIARAVRSFLRWQHCGDILGEETGLPLAPFLRGEKSAALGFVDSFMDARSADALIRAGIVVWRRPAKEVALLLEAPTAASPSSPTATIAPMLLVARIMHTIRWEHYNDWEPGNEAEQVERLLRVRCHAQGAAPDSRRPLLDARVFNAEKTLGRLRFTLDLTFDRGDGTPWMRAVTPWTLLLE